MRRPIAIATWLSLVALLVALAPAAVNAKAPTRFHDLSTSLDCFADTDDGFLYLSLTTSTAFGLSGDLAFWAAPAAPEDDPPTYLATDGVASGDATGLQAVIQVAEFDPEADPPFGAALDPVIVDVQFQPAGDPIPFDEPFREGNRKGRESGSIQFLVPSGTITLPGADLTDLSSCSGTFRDTTFFGTNPAGFNVRFAEFSVSCEWETETGFVSLFASADEVGAFADIFIVDAEREIGGGIEATLTETGLTVPEIVLFDFTNDAEVGTGSASATLTATGETVRIVNVNGRDRTKVVATLFSVDGALDVTLEGIATSYPMDDEHCQAADSRQHVHEVRPAGPPAKRITNDTPATAAPLRIGRTARLTTGLGAPAPEAPCVLDDDFEVPFGHTAWWSVVGNGSAMTADSAGSLIDTVMGVYVRQGTTIAQVGCVDDVFHPDGSVSFQAAVTWDSVAGVTYLIQLGGFGGQTGQLKLVVR